MCALGVALAALLLRTHKGGHDSGRSNGPFSPARAPSQRFGWRPSCKSAQKVDRFCVRARAPTPVRRRGVQAQGDTHTVPSSSKAEAKQRAPPYTLQLPRPDSVGDAQARKACTAGPGQPHRSKTRGGVMRGGDGWLSSPSGGTSTGHDTVEVVCRRAPRM